MHKHKNKQQKGGIIMLGSFRGIPFKIFALILAVIALGAGVYISFFQSAGFEKTTATIISIEDDPDYTPNHDDPNDRQRIVTIKYTVDGKDYTRKLDSDSPDYSVGKEVEVRYDPKNPGTVHSTPIFGYVFMGIGGVIIVAVIIWIVKDKKAVKQLKETRAETTYLPSEKGELRTLYFKTDLGTPKYGHQLEDKNRRVLYEAKMTKFTMTSPFGFDFIDHEKNTVTPHLVGHEEDTEWNSLLLDDHFTFKFDGEDVWKHLKRNGITVESKLVTGNTLTSAYTIFRDGVQIAYMEATSKYVHEEDEQEHKAAGKLPVRGFYRVRTDEKNLDLLFVVILAFARSGAADGKGGKFGMLTGTFKSMK